MGSIIECTRKCTLDYQTTFYHQLDKILQVCIGKNEAEFISVCHQIDTKGKKNQFDELTNKIVKALSNIRNLLNGNVKSIFPEISNLSKGTHEAIIDHITEKVRLLQAEKNKNIEDARAMKKGERLKIEDREAFKLVKAIQAGVFK